MNDQYILALDQGTTSSRAVVIDKRGKHISLAQKEFQQIYPQPGWVEHDPQEIWSTQLGVAAEAMTRMGLSSTSIAAIGITNQRETTIIWERKSGRPIYNAIVWQDRRTAEYCDELKRQGHENRIRSKTGLPIDAYFSATKIHWILQHVPGAREQARRGELAFGTVDSWLIWNLTQHKLHVTDVSNASRTMLFNIHTMEWDEELLALMAIPRELLPQVCDSSGIVGHTAPGLFAASIPIAGIAGDQQAALFGQLCTKPGMVKNTYGTGCFMMMNTGTLPVESGNNLITTIAWKIGDQRIYALEGSIFIGGAVVQWLRDGLGIINHASEIEELARQVTSSDGVTLVPAFAGLGAPYWNPYARGTLFGVTRGTSSAHLARAALESIAFQTVDVIHAMQADIQDNPNLNAGAAEIAGNDSTNNTGNMNITELRVDGGAVDNALLMQFQADILGVDVVQPQNMETTALGAAYLAGLAIGYWQDIAELEQQWQLTKRYTPSMPLPMIGQHLLRWQRAVGASIAWAGYPQKGERDES